MGVETGDMEVLARRAVACPKWAWLGGMLTTDGDRVVSAGDASAINALTGSNVAPLVLIDRVDEDGGNCWLPDGALPDLTDPATLGCLLALVRRAWSDPTLHLQPYSTFDSEADEQRAWWRLCSVRASVLPGMPAFDVITANQRTYLAGATEAAALIAALEAAP